MQNELDRRLAARAKADARAEDEQTGTKKKTKKGDKTKNDDNNTDKAETTDEKEDKNTDKDPAKWQMAHMALAESRCPARHITISISASSPCYPSQREWCFPCIVEEMV